jgi:hypothetical protein
VTIQLIDSKQDDVDSSSASLMLVREVADMHCTIHLVALLTHCKYTEAVYFMITQLLQKVLKIQGLSIKTMGREGQGLSFEQIFYTNLR